MPKMIFTLLVDHVKNMRFEYAKELLDEYEITPRQMFLYQSLIKIKNETA
jgi:hypothetical protein